MTSGFFFPPNAVLAVGCFGSLGGHFWSFHCIEMEPTFAQLGSSSVFSHCNTSLTGESFDFRYVHSLSKSPKENDLWEVMQIYW